MRAPSERPQQPTQPHLASVTRGLCRVGAQHDDFWQIPGLTISDCPVTQQCVQQPVPCDPASSVETPTAHLLGECPVGYQPLQSPAEISWCRTHHESLEPVADNFGWSSTVRTGHDRLVAHLCLKRDQSEVL